jgi:hypothetical protein
MTRLSSILNFLLFALLAVTLVFAGLFFFGGEVVGAAYHTPTYTEAFLDWGKILFFCATALAIVFEIAAVVSRPKNAIPTLISLLVLGTVVLIAYSLGDPTPLNLVGYEGPDNVPSMLIMSDTFIYTMYFLFGIAVLTIAYSEISRMFR